MEYLLVAIVLGLIPAFIAQHKGRSFLTWWLFGALLWIVVLPITLLMKPDPDVMRQRELAGGSNKRCPACAEAVKAEAVVCRYCGHRFNEPTTRDPLQPAAE